MKVTVGERVYAIEFEYGWIGAMPRARVRCDVEPQDVESWRAGGGQLRERTTCRIRDLSAPSPGDGTFPVVAQGIVTRFWKDTPNRETGRKRALAKALQASAPIIECGLPWDDCEPAAYRDRLKWVRRPFWEAYLNRPRNKSAEPAAARTSR